MWTTLFLCAAQAAPEESTPSTSIATVLEHRVSVSIDASLALSETVTWTVRVDDPVTCSAGVLAPPGLDGAADGGAQVLEDLLVIPAETAKGAVFTLTATNKLPPGAHSGVFYTAPDLPTERAMLTVTAPARVPLTVWADPAATSTYDTRAARTVRMEWSGLRPGALAQASYSTYRDWIEAGNALNYTVKQKLADKMALGKELASDSLGMGLAGMSHLVSEIIALDPHGAHSWESARPAAEVAKSRSGSASERGLVLLSLLKLAGFDAMPAYYRPSSAPGGFPVTVPAPALLPSPLIAVRREEGTVYIDPAAEHASVPERPASLLGATVWLPDELPYQLPESSVIDGSVTVNTQLSLQDDGSATFTANLVAAGAAQEYLRALLAPLEEADRSEAFLKLLTQGRPEGSRLAAEISGVDAPDRKLTISLTGRDDRALTAGSPVRSAKVAPLIAPALAAWLPPKVAISEIMSISPPTSLVVLGHTLDEGLYRTEAAIGRRAEREGQRVVFVTEIERPYRSTTPAIEASAAQMMSEEAGKGVHILLFGSKISAALKAIESNPDLSPEDRAALVPMMWHGVGNDKKAARALEASIEAVGPELVIAKMFSYSDPGAMKGFSGLLSTPGIDDLGRVRYAEELAASSARSEARSLAEDLTDSNDAQVRVRALLLRERLLIGDPAIDKDVRAKHTELLDLAQGAAEGLEALDGARVEIALRRAQLALAADDPAAALAALEGAPQGPIEALLLASASGSPVEALRDLAQQMLAEHADEPYVISAASSALARAGDHREALSLALTAARVAHSDPELWGLVISPALGVGDLPTAAYAAKRASDLDPDDTARAGRWGILATLMLSREEAEAAYKRAKIALPSSWPPSVDQRMDLDDAAILAVLEHAEDDVAKDPRLLAIRAQMRIESASLDEAAHDGLLLATRHAKPEGYALAFAATAGRQYSTSLLAALDEAARSEPTAMTTRMEYRLVSGAGEPLDDARRLGTDPRAKTVMRWAIKPKEAVTAIEAWPARLSSPPSKPPAGFRKSWFLSVLPGVIGFSNPEAAIAAVRVGSPEMHLPPPFGLLYEQSPQLVESTEDGLTVLSLEGGVMPLYAATALSGEVRCWGFGFTPVSAKRALLASQ